MAETKKTVQTTAEHKAAVKKYNEEKVPVFIRRPESETEDSVTVTLNGKNYQIAYDTKVMVPRKVALIVEEMQRNESNANRKIRDREGMKPLD